MVKSNELEKRGQRSDGLVQRQARRANRGQGSTIDWANASAELIAALVVAATNDGVVISFSYTRDGQALTVGLFKDGDRVTEYCRATEEPDAFLSAIANDYFAG